jgi:hypothetical protein
MTVTCAGPTLALFTCPLGLVFLPLARSMCASGFFLAVFLIYSRASRSRASASVASCLAKQNRTMPASLPAA